MLQIKLFVLVICLYALLDGSHGVDKYTDENRPYEFGFTIDGEQHRHEKKDENGIIMGEFGFITADGVYHVTVYATDKEGRFKILSMKNIRVKPYPTAATGVKKGHSIPFPPSENAPVLQGPSTFKPPEISKQEPQQITSTAPKQIASPAPKLIASPAKSCSHCSIPTTTTKAPQLTDIAIVSKDRPKVPSSQPSYSQNNQLSALNGQGGFGQQENNKEQNVFTSDLQQNSSPGLDFDKSNAPPISSQQNYQQNYPQQGVSNYPNYPPQESDINKNYPRLDNPTNSNFPGKGSYANSNTAQQGNYNSQLNPQNGNNVNQNGGSQNYPSSGNINNPYQPQEQSNINQRNPPELGDAKNNYAPQASLSPPRFEPELPTNLQTPQGSSVRNPKQYNEDSPLTYGQGPSQGFGAALASHNGQPVSNKPTLLAAQMQIVPKDTDIHHKRPGEVEGLPEGLSENDMMHLLYTFNYTVGFHGHHEEGYSNGAKQGYYYVTGRNGVRTRVDYVADEKGFRPRISQEVLDLLSDDVPKPETEKAEKFGLKGYEFKWLYYPTEARKQ